MERRDKVVAIIQARMGSTRLPGKVLKNLAGKSVLEHVVERVRFAELVDEVVIAISDKQRDDVIEELCRRKGIAYFRGSEGDVLERTYRTAAQFGAGIIVRVSSDCPLIDFQAIDLLVAQLHHEHLDYIGMKRGIIGLPPEVFSFDALERAYFEARSSYDREHVTSYIYNNEFTYKWVVPEEWLCRPDLRLTLDEVDDLLLLEEIYSRLYRRGNPINLRSVIDLLDAEPEMKSINHHG